MALADQIVQAESGGNPNAANPRSSASGPGQFLNSTWLSVLAAHRPDLTASMSPQQLLALKNDPQLSRDMTAAYAADNAKVLQGAGFAPTRGNLYLAHFAGPQGAVALLSNPNASAASVLGPAVVKANPFLARMNAQDVAQWAAGRVGAQPSAPVPSQPSQSVAAPAQPSAAAGLLSGIKFGQSQPQGLLESAVDNELQQRLSAIPGMLEQMQPVSSPPPMMPMAPINMPQSPARQMAQFATPQMQMAMQSPAALLRRQLLATLMQQPTPSSQG